MEVILQSLKERHPQRNEVIIPAYTAPGLILPIRKLGLTPRLCDISLETFTLDPLKLSSVITPNTLAVIAVHMFGISADIDAIRNAVGKDVCIIEDFAQSMGTEHDNTHTGSRADISFGSFGRGKNFSLYGGGFIAINSSLCDESIDNIYSKLPVLSLYHQIAHAMKFIVFSLLTVPFVYAQSAFILSRLKSTKEREEYIGASMGAVTKTLAKYLFPLWRESHTKRVVNGTISREIFSHNKEIMLPLICKNSKTAFNRFPIVVKSSERRTAILSLLNKKNIEASPMYNKPVHLMWEIGYHTGDFPAAEFFATHLITLPVHGQLKTEEINTIADVLNNTRSSSTEGNSDTVAKCT
jgi:dTDP-4-amino-4,6-dideoxygalactose transaminase